MSVEFADLSPGDAAPLSVKFEGLPAHVTAVTRKRALVLVPTLDGGGDCGVSLSVGEEPTPDGPTILRLEEVAQEGLRVLREEL